MGPTNSQLPAYSETQDEKHAIGNDAQVHTGNKDGSPIVTDTENKFGNATRSTLLERYHAINSEVQNFNLGFLRDNGNWIFDKANYMKQHKEKLEFRTYWIKWGSDEQVEELIQHAEEEIVWLRLLKESRLELYRLGDDEKYGKKRHKDCTQMMYGAGYKWHCPLWGERTRPLTYEESLKIQRQYDNMEPLGQMVIEEGQQMLSKIWNWFT